jgi:hypothetical protein
MHPTQPPTSKRGIFLALLLIVVLVAMLGWIGHLAVAQLMARV